MFAGVDTKHTLKPRELQGILFKPACAWTKFDPPRLLYFEHNGQPTKTRRYVVMDSVTATSGLGVFNCTVNTVVRALLERYFMVKVGGEFVRPLTAVKGKYDLANFTRFRQIVCDDVAPDATRLSDVQTVALYSGPKRKLYENAMKSLCRVAVSRRDAKLKPFPKMEKQNLGKAPRIINPRTPRYNLELARYLKLSEKLFYRGINKAFGNHTAHTVLKGLDCYETASVVVSKFKRFADPIFVGGDAVKYDAHVGRSALEYEHSFYLTVFQFAQPLAKLLAMQLVNRGKAYCLDGFVEFIMEATRCSGDINTSLGNCIICCAIVWAWCDAQGIEVELMNNGDDWGCVMERGNYGKFRHGIIEFFAECGFRLELEAPVDEIERVEFCQSRPVFDGERWRMMRNPLACFQKDGMCLLPMTSARTLRKWLGAVGECGLAMASGLPVMQAWYNMFKRAGSTPTKRFKQHVFAHTNRLELAGKNKAVVREIHPDARVSFYAATGVSPDLQIALEGVYDRHNLSTNLVADPREVYDCQSLAVLQMAPDIFDTTKLLPCQV